MITADTITDEQIRELRGSEYQAYMSGDRSRWDIVNLCRIALTEREPTARARCAEILNARAAKVLP